MSPQPRPFHDPRSFPFFSQLEPRWRELRDELLPAMQKGVTFLPQRNDLLSKGAVWKHFVLYVWGLPVPPNIALAPSTATLAAEVPNLLQVAVYQLGPRSHILPHSGTDPRRLRAHLGLSCPEGCWLRVDTQTESEEDGKLLVFDDTFEHEARNPASESRYVLHFDFGKPWGAPISRDELSAYRLKLAESNPSFVPTAVAAGMELDGAIRDRIASGVFPRASESDFEADVWQGYLDWLGGSR